MRNRGEIAGQGAARDGRGELGAAVEGGGVGGDGRRGEREGWRDGRRVLWYDRPRAAAGFGEAAVGRGCIWRCGARRCRLMVFAAAGSGRRFLAASEWLAARKRRCGNDDRHGQAGHGGGNQAAAKGVSFHGVTQQARVSKVRVSTACGGAICSRIARFRHPAHNISTHWANRRFGGPAFWLKFWQKPGGYADGNGSTGS
jgi:hypothetical protein